MSGNCDAIAIFPIYGQFGAIRKPDSGHIVWKTYVFMKSKLLILTERRTKESQPKHSFRTIAFCRMGVEWGGIYSDIYLQICHTSKVELFVNIVNDFALLMLPVRNGSLFQNDVLVGTIMFHFSLSNCSNLENIEN